jgi:uncharacterized protein YggE
VNGGAEFRVVPDEVLLSLGVETFDKVLRSSKSLNDDRIKRAIAVARSFGVPGEYIQTDYIGIEPKYHRSDITQELGWTAGERVGPRDRQGADDRRGFALD